MNLFTRCPIHAYKQTIKNYIALLPSFFNKYIKVGQYFNKLNLLLVLLCVYVNNLALASYMHMPTASKLPLILFSIMLCYVTAFNIHQHT